MLESALELEKVNWSWLYSRFSGKTQVFAVASKTAAVGRLAATFANYSFALFALLPLNC